MRSSFQWHLTRKTSARLSSHLQNPLPSASSTHLNPSAEQDSAGNHHHFFFKCKNSMLMQGLGFKSFKVRPHSKFWPPPHHPSSATRHMHYILNLCHCLKLCGSLSARPFQGCSKAHLHIPFVLGLPTLAPGVNAVCTSDATTNQFAGTCERVFL